MQMNKKVLLTGGSGYIGSHIYHALSESGYVPIVVDNLSTGYDFLVPKDAEFYRGDICDTDWLDGVFKKVNPDAVIHLAAFAAVEESVREPLKYYRNNVGGTVSLLEVCRRNNVKNIVFSSTCAVYGNPADTVVREDAPLNPVSPYGISKKMAEDIILDLTSKGMLNSVILRYFNVVGADKQGRTGLCNAALGRLDIKVCQAALGEIQDFNLYGTDYDTPDGTAVRDYIHVSDLANAHVAAIEYLLAGGKSDIFNVGYGRGYSVREYIESVKRVSGNNFKVIENQRRAGDAEKIIADISKIKTALKWNAEYDNLDDIIKTSLTWRKKVVKITG